MILDMAILLGTPIIIIISIRTKCTNTETRKPTRKTTTMAALQTINKCIGNDTKAAARQSINCIKNKKK